MSPRAPLPFTKLEALGNDFVLVDARTRTFTPTAAMIRSLGDRRRGVGFDQLLILDPPASDTELCSVRIYNCDGSPAEQCGNGMRAIALWLHEAGLLTQAVHVQTPGGPVELRAEPDGAWGASLGVPDFRPRAWGGATDHDTWSDRHDGREITLHGVSVGNPHLVIPWPHTPRPAEVAEMGERFGQAPFMPTGANVSLACVKSRHQVELAVFERGAGATPACGSAACATAAVLIRQGLTDSPVTIAQPGGKLVIHWPQNDQPVYMAGPARRVFEGWMELQTPA